jgi:selenoprotein W-related protein
MAQELVDFRDGSERCFLIPGTGGIFEVIVNQTTIWSRKERGRFPDIKELKQLVRDHVAPGKDLGHTDR